MRINRFASATKFHWPTFLQQRAPHPMVARPVIVKERTSARVWTTAHIFQA
jgi:hypothetical protein